MELKGLGAIPPSPIKNPSVEESNNELIALAKTSSLLEPFIDRLQKEGEAAWGEFFRHILSSLNIKPEYIKSSDGNFGEMRRKLENEPEF